MGPLHPMTQRFVVDDSTRAALSVRVYETLGDTPVPMPLSSIGEHPLVMSERLDSEVNARVSLLCGWIRDQHAAGRWRDDPEWGNVGAPDSLCVDLAIVKDDTAPGGWGVRWVEFQAFLSAAVTAYAMHEAARNQWPALNGLRPWDWTPEFGDDWISASKAWLAPAAGGALLEEAPLEQKTAWDLCASARMWGLNLVDAAHVREQGGALQGVIDGEWRDLPHVVNRLILHEARDQDAVRRAVGTSTTSWRNHPAWYYRVNKGMLAELPLPEHERCARADRWRMLGLPPEALVLKAIESFGGTDVHMNVTAEQLDSLPNANGWLVQPRYEVLPLLMARDGAPLYGEIRVMVALKEVRPPWVASRFARINRGKKTSARLWSGLPGEGISPVYPPPRERERDVAGAMEA